MSAGSFGRTIATCNPASAGSNWHPAGRIWPSVFHSSRRRSRYTARDRRRWRSRWPPAIRSVSAIWVASGGHQSITWRIAQMDVIRLRGGDQEPDAEGRRQGHAEGADTDRPTLAVKALERLEEPGGMAKLAVVVVLDDRGTRAAGPAQEPESPVPGHHDTERVLM